MESKGFLDDQRMSQLPRTPSPSRVQSHTLPPNFTFHHDEPMTTPRTPQPQMTSTPEMPQPPEPPKIRIKRRRAAPFGAATSFTVDTTMSCASDRVPSIQLSEPAGPDESSNSEQVTASQPLAEPMPQTYRTLSPVPQTPLSKLQTSFGSFREGLKTPEPWSAQSQWSKGASITRPSSTWSELSDSSASSLSSFATDFTHGESTTSPESEAQDPFISDEHKEALMPSAIPKDLRVRGKRVKKHLDNEWTREMDEHLWLTYMTYLSDPTVTPFKTLPGTAPPLGVCHRVARRAKKQWKGPRSVLSTLDENGSASFASIDANVMRRESSLPPMESPGTVKPLGVPRSFSAGARRHPFKWPVSGSSTRKRLRDLCKHKVALSPHYQRLMHSRSPSPFESSSSQGPPTSPPKDAPHQSSFSTRHMNVMLTTSTASSMQPGNPLSQLASSSPKTPQRSNPHLKSPSLQSTFGMPSQAQHQEGLAELRRLASPFQEKPREDDVRGETPTAPGPAANEATLRPQRALELFRPLPQQRRLASPLQIHQPRPLTASMKRRAQYPLGEELLTDDPEARQSFLEEYGREPANGSGKRRIRSRGFSLGAVRHETESSRQPSMQLNELFTPPTTTDTAQPSSSAQPPTTQPVANLGTPFQPQLNGSLMPAPTFGNDAARRLGSPFVPTGNVGMSNTFPRSLFPQGLDSISNLEAQRQQPSQSQTDVEMEDPFTGPSQTEESIFGRFAQSSSGTIRRYPNP